MNKDLLRKYFQNEDFHPITIVVGAKRITLENDINIDYQNEVIIYPMPQTTRIIPFTSITYIDLKDTKNTHINLYKLEQGPQQKGMRQAFQQTTQVGVGAPTKRNAPSISTNNASWGGGPNREKCEAHFVKHSKLGWAQQRQFGTSLYFRL